MIVVQPDGKILLGGGFRQVAGAARERLARLHPDGSIDHSFDAGPAPLRQSVRNMSVRSDGSIVVVYEVAGDDRPWVTVIDATGRAIPDFPRVDRVRAAVAQPDGKIVITGFFTSVQGVARTGIARLNADGSLDESFGAGAGLWSGSSLTMQADGKIIVAGNFTSVHGVARGGIARLNADGSLDADFATGAGLAAQWYMEVSAVAVQADGKILVAGSFRSYDGVTRHNVARLYVDGSLDEGFDPGTNVNGYVNSMAVHTDGSVCSAASSPGPTR